MRRMAAKWELRRVISCGIIGEECNFIDSKED